MEIPVELSETALNQIGAVMQEMALKAFKDAGTKQSFGPYMTKQEAAKYLHVSSQTLNAFIAEGLEVTTIGNITRISKESANKFMEAHTI
ncbi:helix-turn-helix domain-containing protein [Levilactobacillus brevis]|uniref:Helix-turn-helix domain-containing protein n=1 Tax=Levilactobacillus hammesii TaxID=267633 RepID=A0A921JXQ8_9LACO|nr:helix-turn-helix domain-containing protein [Levilactobacillus brevis]HJE87102.1 helix-turn-helix domain-containing protein [Levilactobacillus hammesii]